MAKGNMPAIIRGLWNRDAHLQRLAQVDGGGERMLLLLKSCSGRDTIDQLAAKRIGRIVENAQSPCAHYLVIRVDVSTEVSHRPLEEVCTEHAHTWRRARTARVLNGRLDDVIDAWL